MVEMVGHLHGVDCQFDVHVSLHLAPSKRIDELFRRLCHDCESIVIEPIDQWSYRRILLVLDQCRIIERSDQFSSALKFFQ